VNAASVTEEPATQRFVIDSPPSDRPEINAVAEKSTGGDGSIPTRAVEREPLDDVPSELKALEKQKKESALARTGEKEISPEREEVFTEIRQAKALIESEEKAPAAPSEGPVFSQLSAAAGKPAQGFSAVPGRLFIGAGILLLFVSLVTGFLINRYSQSTPQAGQTAAADAPTEPGENARAAAASPQTRDNSAEKMGGVDSPEEKTVVGPAASALRSPAEKERASAGTVKLANPGHRPQAATALDKARSDEKRQVNQSAARRTAVAKNARPGQNSATGKKAKTGKKLSPAEEAEILGRPRIIKNAAVRRKN
jgi:hypothetical protein